MPPLGIAGAGIALCGAYVVMLGVMHLLTRRAFRVGSSGAGWLQLVGVMGGVAVGRRAAAADPRRGRAADPRGGVRGDPWRCWTTGFAHPQELGQAAALLIARGGSARRGSRR